VLFAFAAFATAADRGPRRVLPPAQIQTDEPEAGEEGENAEPEVPDEDDGLDDGQAAPLPHRPGPTLPGARDPSTPREEDEEPAAPPERRPIPSGPAEPASARQPVSPE
jgi:hypothetical protein